MALFKKPILSSGKYLASKSDGSRSPSSFTTKKLREMASTTNAMIAAGMNIPAPFDHSPAAVPVTELAASPSYNNGGYWKRFWVSDESGKPTLYGELDAPGDIADFNTPAGKVGTTVKECSLSVRPEFEDGKGKKWSNPIMHVALCTHPIDHGQANFELAEDNMAVSMSCMLSSVPNESDLTTLREKLKSVANIFLPDTCDSKNLVDFLLVSLQQMELGKLGDAQKDDTVIEPSPVFLSLPQEIEMKFTKDQAKAIVDSGAVNPSTTKPYTYEDLGIQMSAPKETPANVDTSELQKEVDKLRLFSAVVSNNLLAEKKTGIQKRIQSLIDTKRITKSYADAELAPQMEQVSLSFKDGEIEKHPLEMMLSALEQLPVPKSETPAAGFQFNLPNGAQIHDPENAGAAEMSDEEMDKIATEFCTFVD